MSEQRAMSGQEDMNNKQTPLLSVNNLCVDYITNNGSARAVNDVSIDIMAGETLGIAGESGCGKSTLAFAITKLHSMPALISGGQIYFEREDVLTMNEERLRQFRWKQASMVFQSAMNSLNPVITIGEQLTDVVISHENVTKQEAWERAAQTLEKVGIHGSRVKSYPHQLSGGMRQRVAIAIALILKPKLIIMDEPTTALDVVVEREIMDELNELKQEIGFSILFISHDLGLMEEITDRVGIMYAGKMVEYGLVDELMKQPRHPYTKGLLSSFPSIYGPKVRLEGIPGNPLNLLDTPQGCYFAERCNHTSDTCLQQIPNLVPAPDTHTDDNSDGQDKMKQRLIACHHPVDVIPAGEAI